MKPPSPRLTALALGALGVVYGDIGTSPLYAFRECVHGLTGSQLTDRALGSASLVVWALVALVTVKYLILVLRADNQGEGGILALMALALGKSTTRPGPWLTLGLLGAALLYGDGILTPAVTVLGALEGLKESWPGTEPLVVPGAVLIILLLFGIQRFGTGRVGTIFGPVMLVWFITLAVLGLLSIAQHPSVLAALDPRHAWHCLVAGGWHGFAILGSVFLAVTGAEALYADLGHFGREPIRLAWSALVFPSLTLNYLGQAALVLRDPSGTENPFYRIAPAALQLPLVILATLAGIVASQALISGAFSLTMQAVQLGFLPRLDLQHTSASHRGQIYIGPVNALLALGCLLIVVTFRSSAALAAAYGIAVSFTMVITTILLGVVARRIWHWDTPRIVLAVGSFLAVDLAFLGSNLLRFLEGGWLPLILGAAVFVTMVTWKRGRASLVRRLRSRSVTLEDFIQQVQASTSVQRVRGTAIFLAANPDGAPVALLHNLKHNHVVHERVILLRFATADLPHVPPAARLDWQPLPAGFHRLVASFGFMEEPTLEAVRTAAKERGLEWNDMETTYFLGREAFARPRHPVMPRWQSALFRLLSRNAQQPASFYRLPPNRVVELGVQLEI